MNKVKEFLEKVRRHQFWILCGLVALFGVATWYLGTAKLAEQFTKNKAKVTAAKSTAETVLNYQDHPNDKFTVKIGDAKAEQVKKVEKNWKELYTTQKQNVYVWPAYFVKDFGNRDAPPKKDEVAEGIRNFYSRHVKEVQLKELVAIVDAEWRELKPVNARDAALPGNILTHRDDNTAPKHRVTWNDPTWANPFFFNNTTPTELQVWYAQEEIWVLKALCKAIAATNADSTGAHDTSIKSIEEIAVGYPAAEEAPNGTGDLRVKRITLVPIATTPDPNAATISAPGGKLLRPARPHLGDLASGPGMRLGAAVDETGAALTTVDQELNEWRYVDLTGKPLTKEDLATVSFQEFRLLPWRLRVTLDQRKLDDFLVEIRNSAMPLQVRQVRINPELTGATGLIQNPTDPSDQLMSGITLVTVELRGSAYLINPPDMSKISTSREAGGEVISP
ncbi:MAG: hypothetical protein SGJ20_19660 [Planctomycetota bacterium]|nr:hypothetical protein [Planctomycetota bacterium]